MTFNRNTLKRAARCIKIAEAMTTNISDRNHIEEIQLYTAGFAEPGYHNPESGIIALGNWNGELPRRLYKIFEQMDITCDWSDEWECCDDCGKLIRTQADCYHWQRSYWVTDDGFTCIECVEKDPDSYLSYYEGNANGCITINSIDPADHGYVKVNDDSYETGWHPGQTDNPRAVAKELREKGIERFLFRLDEQSQFYSRWSVYVHKDEEEKLHEKKLPKPNMSVLPVVITEDDYNELQDCNGGLCLSCGELTWDGYCEPDAEHYPCGNCGENNVQGIENALISEHIVFDENDNERSND